MEDIVTVKKAFPSAQLAVASTVIAVVAVIVAGVSWYHMDARMTALAKETKSTFIALTDMQKQQQQTLLSHAQMLADYQTSLQKMIATNNHGFDTLAIFDALYLTKEASDQLHYEHNITAAIQLLTSAKNRLEGFNNAMYQPAIRALTSDIAALEKIEKVDTQAVYLMLSNALNVVPHLPIAVSPHHDDMSEKNDDPVPEKATAEDSMTWSQSIKSSWQELKNLVSVRHDSVAIPSVLTYRQSVFLYENVSALISQTQYAVLHGDDAIFHENLKQLIEWLNNYFVTKDPQVSDMLLMFKKLQKINIHPVVPDIQSSLSAMAALQAQEVNAT